MGKKVQFKFDPSQGRSGYLKLGRQRGYPVRILQ